jgi:hypothetical protein
MLLCCRGLAKNIRLAAAGCFKGWAAWATGTGWVLGRACASACNLTKLETRQGNIQGQRLRAQDAPPCSLQQCEET